VTYISTIFLFWKEKKGQVTFPSFLF